MQKIRFLLLILISLPLILFISSSCKGKKEKVILSGFYYEFIPYHLESSSKLKLSKGNLTENLYWKTEKEGKNNHYLFNFLGHKEYSSKRNIHLETKSTDFYLKGKSIMPPIEFNWNGVLSGAKISKELLLDENAILKGEVKNLDLDMKVSIESFDLLIPQGDTLKTLSSKKASFSDQQLALLQSIEGTTLLVFNNIKYKDIANRNYTAAPFVLILE